MSSPYILKKSYINHLGLDLKSTDLVRPDGFASEIKNAQYKKSGAIEKRTEYQAYALDDDRVDTNTAHPPGTTAPTGPFNAVGGFGLFSYNRVYPTDISSLSIVSGQADKMLVSLSKKIHKKETATLNIVYTGSNVSVFLNIYFDKAAAVYKCTIFDASTTTNTFELSLGQGVYETNFSAVTPAYVSIKVLYDALVAAFPVDYTITFTGNEFIPAAFLRITRDQNLFEASSDGVSVDAAYWVEVPSSVTNPFAGSDTNKAKDNFENISAAEINNIIYLSNGYDSVKKFDGSFIYAAGLPAPAYDSIAINLTSTHSDHYSTFIDNDAADGLFFSYKFNYLQTDNSGNQYEGNITSNVINGITEQQVTKQFVKSTVTAVTSAAVVAATLPVTISVGANTIAANEWVYFTSTTGGSHTVVAHISSIVANTSITIDQLYRLSTGVQEGNIGDAVPTLDVAITSTIRKYLETVITFPTLQNTVSEYNVRQLVSSGTVTSVVTNQTNVTNIAATASHTFRAGDFVYFFDNASKKYMTANIKSITGSNYIFSNIQNDLATTVTSITINSGDVICNGLRMSIFRSIGFSTGDGGEAAAKAGVHYLLGDAINNSSSNLSTFADLFNSTEILSKTTFVDQAVDRSPPPKGKYLCSFRGLIIVAGNTTNSSSIYWSDSLSSENFPASANNTNIDSVSGDSISGIAGSNNTLVVFKDRSIHTVSGDIVSGSIRIEPLVTDIGCAAHATIQEVRGTLYFLSDRGPYKMVGAQIPIPVGDSRIEPIFDSYFVSDTKKLRLKRSVGFNDRQSEKYLLFVPAESEVGGEKYSNSSSKVFACDFYRDDAWLQWSNYDFSAGIASIDNELYFVGRALNNDSASVRKFLYRKMNNNDAFDYQDNIDPIDWEYSSGWESLGEPSVYKRFLKLRMFALEDLPNNELTLTVKSEVNYISDADRASFSFTLSGTGYGSSSYGDSEYGDNREFAEYRRLNPGRFRSMRIRYSNSNDQENVILTGWELEISPSYKPEFKK